MKRSFTNAHEHTPSVWPKAAVASLSATTVDGLLVQLQTLSRVVDGLPVVVYVPEGVEVRYRIWTAGDEIETIEEG